MAKSMRIYTAVVLKNYRIQSYGICNALHKMISCIHTDLKPRKEFILIDVVSKITRIVAVDAISILLLSVY